MVDGDPQQTNRTFTKRQHRFSDTQKKVCVCGVVWCFISICMH